MSDPAPPLQVRGLDRETYDAFRRGAAARGITQAEYLKRLVALHTSCRVLDDTGILATVGLDPIQA